MLNALAKFSPCLGPEFFYSKAGGIRGWERGANLLRSKEQTPHSYPNTKPEVVT